MTDNTDHSSTPDKTFSGYLTNPAGIGLSDEKNLEILSERFPYAQTLHAFQAKAYQDSARFEQYLSKASLYAPNRDTLYHVIYKTDELVSVPAKAETAAQLQENVQDQPDAVDAAARAADLQDNEFGEEVIQLSEATYPSDEDIETELVTTEEEFMLAADAVLEQPFAGSEVETTIPDSEIEVFGDIVIDAEAEVLIAGADIEVIGDAETDLTSEQSDPEQTEVPADETEKQIISNIASSDFFRFEDKIDDRLTTHFPQERIAGAEQNKAGGEGVSKYDDDTMPYTFRWWLHKTRQEHSDTYQPYVNFKLDTTEQIKKESAPVLNQQIIENIFHLQSPFDDIPEKPKSQTVEFTLKRKDDQIIERFIREEPQIRPPRPEKLDTENKARKSSEDSYDMVSETLAQVYIEQMLFNKAIDTYKKLSLKFPEKSTYFADQIRKLEITNKD